MDAAPQWVGEHNLRRVGLYYEGYVDDTVLDVLRQQHQAYTVSTFGIRRSTSTAQKTQEKENKVIIQ